MFGEFLFGEKLFGTSSVLSTFVPSEDFSFNNYGLQNPTRYGIHIRDYEVETPEREFETANVPGGHGLILLQEFYRKNPIILNGWISATSREALEQKRHEMLRNIHQEGGTLYIKNGGSFKEIDTTLQKATFTNLHGSNTKSEFKLEFSGIRSFWRENSYSSVFFENQTASPLTGEMNNQGSFKTPPIFLMIFSAASGITGIEIKNNTTGSIIEMTQNVSAGDVVIFDFEQKIVTINAAEKEFDGRMGLLNVGLNSFTITLTGGAATYDVTAKHKNQYLTP